MSPQPLFWRRPAPRTAAALGLVAAVAFGAVGQGLAQTAEEDSVNRRARPDYDPIGVQPDLLGSFILFPKVATAINFNDNVFADDTGKRSDFFYTVTPSLVLRSDWDNHALNVNGRYSLGRYFEEVSEDFDDFSFGTSGHVDVSEVTRANFSATHNREHESRGSPDDVGGAEPTIFFLSEGAFDVNYLADAFGLKPFVRSKRYNFRDNAAANNDDRDRTETDAGLRASYEATPGTIVFIEPSFRWVDYDDAVDDNGFARSGTGYRIDAGMTLDVSGVTFIEFQGGVLKRKLDDAVLEDVDGLFGKARAVWNPTDLSTLTLTAERQVNETTTAGAASTTDNVLTLSYDHEFLENVILNASGEYEMSDFVGIGRDDDTIKAKLALRYLMVPEVWWELRYGLTARDSNLAGEDFVSNTALFSLVLQR